MSEPANLILTLTTQIAAAYVGSNTLESAAVPGLIRAIQRSLSDLAPTGAVDSTRPRQPELRATAPPAVEISKSVFANHLVCLEEGLETTLLKRHLRTAHGLTPEQYRAKWGLPATYPMVAPNYAKVRSRLAKEFGLGRKKIQ
jgi:predicted transcriptional regulator